MGKLTPQKVVIVAGTDAYPKGYHEGNPGGLDAVDTDLATASIKSGINIFGKAGSTDVRDSTDADLIVGEAPTGKTFYAGGGARKTGDGTKTLSAANETVNAGYYAATTLSTVDGDLVTGNIKQGVTIFGKAGTVVEAGTETIDKYASASIANDATYTPGDSGIFYIGQYNQATEYYSTGDGVWHQAGNVASFTGANAIGDGTNYRLKNKDGGSVEHIIMRHIISTWTYERARDEDLGAGASWTPATSGFFNAGIEDTQVYFELNRTTAGWSLMPYGNTISGSLCMIIGDGTNFRVRNNSGAALYHVTMRAGLN